ncbi:MAG: hypothetical protein SVW02_04245 [Candidatus Nanohaloarchaea archaeon]|nr:hypothetical protein [Candidatus Nanohaloarchaea archaeon]
MGLRDKIPFLGSKYASKALVYRNRSGTPVAEETEAIRMQYDELPDIHRLKTGEETKAAELRGITQVYPSDDPIYYTEYDGQILLFRGVTDSLSSLETTGGRPLIHFYEAEAGQLLNFVPSFDTDDLTGDIHEALEQGDLEKADLDMIDDEVAIENYIIDDKDERLTAHMDHLERLEEKYKKSKAWWKNDKAAIIFATGMAVAMIIAVTLHFMGDWVPLLEKLTRQIPNLINAIQSASGGSTPPGQ